MAWSAPSEWERWDPDKLLVCPYDQLHVVPAKRYQYHVIKCRENYPEKDFVSCPFNAKHIMLRTELRRHITRCQDRGEVEPYSFQGNEKDSEGFYFKGDTSVPCYKKDTVSRPQEEDWDIATGKLIELGIKVGRTLKFDIMTEHVLIAVDEETTSQQNLCEFYSTCTLLSAKSGQGIQDVLSLNPSDREEFKRNLRTQAIQSQYLQHGQHNLQDQHLLAHNSSDNQWKHSCEDETLNAHRNGNKNCGRMEQCTRAEKSGNSANQSQWFQPSGYSHHNNEITDKIRHEQPTNFNSQIERRDKIYGISDQNFPREGQALCGISKSNDANASGTHRNGFPLQFHHAQQNGFSTMSGGTTGNFHQSSSHFDTNMGNSECCLGVHVTRPEIRGVENGIERPSLRGAGRAKLAEEARRKNFGLRKGSVPVGRGRGILDLFSPNSK